ncbi:MAG: hypothetical protein GWN00_01925, partial [Aliifodinibius sp.]|nr:hypothetical protein [Fodinibius sp.]NIV10027.1 hypothetical protein [Fodinibius sp.]NIY23615.1 hypothetical protein [Fodinibius sp.]
TSWATAADSIQNAVNAADPGDTIYVGAGVWQEAINVYDNNLSLLGMGTDSTIFENYSGTTIRLWNDTTIIEGFSFISDRETDAISCAYWGFIEVKNNYFNSVFAGVGGNLSGIIKNNYFEDCREALRVVAIRDSMVFENNTIYDNFRFSPILIDDLMQDSSKCHIRKNII